MRSPQSKNAGITHLSQQYQWPNKAVIAFFTKLFMTFLCTSKKFILGQHSHSILLIVISLKDIVKHIKYQISNLSYVMPVILSFRPQCRISILLATDTKWGSFLVWYQLTVTSWMRAFIHILLVRCVQNFALANICDEGSLATVCVAYKSMSW